jgi:hypothetical protein
MYFSASIILTQGLSPCYFTSKDSVEFTADRVFCKTTGRGVKTTARIIAEIGSKITTEEGRGSLWIYHD